MKTLKLRKPEPSERAIQNSIAAVLRFHGFVVVRVNGGGFKDGRGQFVKNYIIYGLNACAGFPDLVAFRDSHFLLIEVKKPRGVLSAAQVRFRRFAAACGVTVHVLRNASEVEALLSE